MKPSSELPVAIHGNLVKINADTRREVLDRIEKLAADYRRISGLQDDALLTLVVSDHLRPFFGILPAGITYAEDPLPWGPMAHEHPLNDYVMNLERDW